MLRGMTSLEYLFLNDNDFSGEIPVAALAALPALKSIYLSNNRFEDVEIANNALVQACKAARGGDGKAVEVDILGQGLLYYGNEYPNAQKGVIHGDF